MPKMKTKNISLFESSIKKVLKAHGIIAKVEVIELDEKKIEKMIDKNKNGEKAIYELAITKRK